MSQGVRAWGAEFGFSDGPMKNSIGLEQNAQTRPVSIFRSFWAQYYRTVREKGHGRGHLGAEFCLGSAKTPHAPFFRLAPGALSLRVVTQDGHQFWAADQTPKDFGPKNGSFLAILAAVGQII